MSLLVGTALLFLFIFILWLMLIMFPPALKPLVALQQNTAGTAGLGENAMWIQWLMLFLVPLLFIGLGIVAAFIVAAFRQEAHRGRI